MNEKMVALLSDAFEDAPFEFDARLKKPITFAGVVLRPEDRDDPWVFRMGLSAYDLGTVKVGFSGHGDTTRVHLGGVVPLTAEKRVTGRRSR